MRNSRRRRNDPTKIWLGVRNRITDCRINDYLRNLPSVHPDPLARAVDGVLYGEVLGPEIVLWGDMPGTSVTYVYLDDERKDNA